MKKILELKSTVTKMKKGFKDRFEWVEEGLNEFEDNIMEMIKSEE